MFSVELFSTLTSDFLRPMAGSITTGLSPFYSIYVKLSLWKHAVFDHFHPFC
jgi:hypothetical protein